MPYDEQLRKRLVRFGQQVRTVRLEAGLSQEGLAHATGMHRTYVGALERGERNVSLGSLFRVADALGVSATHLLEG